MIDNIELIAQSALRIKNNNKIIYFDPYKLTDKYVFDADYIFITHPHYDHFSIDDIIKIKKDNTKIIAPLDMENKLIELDFNKQNILLVEPNNSYKIDSIEFDIIPAYNINKDFHRKEYNWVGYIVNINNYKIYVAGDTDNTKEARGVKCDIASVPIGGTYTMNVLEAVDLIKNIKPKIAIPIHYQTIVGSLEDAYEFKNLLKDEVDVEILMN